VTPDQSTVDQRPQVATDLGQRLLQHEESVLEAVLRAYGPAVGAMLRRKYVILNVPDIEDLLTIALARLWSLREKFDPLKGSLRATFYRLADQATRDLFRHNWHKARRCEVSFQDISRHEAKNVRETAGSPETATADPDRAKCRADVLQIVDNLPAPYRYIVLADACARDRVASAELLAEELEIPEATVRQYRKRAMAAIRGELRQRGYTIP
jgi:RNA polymerase sigma factor (sigma-70 family)